MVPGPAPKDVLGRPTPETPGANGFELLPPSADSAAAQATAEVNSRDLVADSSGFQMLPAAQTALSVSPQSFEPSRASAPFAPVQAGLPTVRADAADDGFRMLPAAPARVDGAALAAPAAAPVAQPVSLPRVAPAEGQGVAGGARATSGRVALTAASPLGGARSGAARRFIRKFGSSVRR